MFPIDRYRFYIYTDKQNRVHTIAVSTYAGKTVKGEAICSTEDTYNEEKGKALAAARCNLKVAQKRLKAADKAVNQADIDYENAAIRLSDMQNYCRDALHRELEAQAELKKVFEEF